MTEALLTGLLLIISAVIAFALKSKWLGGLLLVVGLLVVGVVIVGAISIGNL